jgi:hypothetical protein
MSGPACFFFEGADGELGAGGTVGKILFHPLLKAATAFALGDVDKIMQEQFAVAPGVGANDDGVAKADAPCIVSDYACASRRFSQGRILRQGNAVNDQYSNTGAILDSSPAGIGYMPRA